MRRHAILKPGGIDNYRLCTLFKNNFKIFYFGPKSTPIQPLTEHDLPFVFFFCRTYIMTSKSDNEKIRKRLCDNPNPNETSVFLSRNGISLTYTECLTFLLHIHILDEKVKLHKKRIKEEENVVKQEKIDALVKYFDENDSRPLKKFKKDIHDLLVDVRSNYK